MRVATWLFLFALLAVLLFLLGLALGPVDLSLAQVWAALTGAGGEEAALIVRSVRLPEVIVATVAGAGLAASGLLMQTIFHNPLAGPSVLGISSGASLGVALVLMAAPLAEAVGLPSPLLRILAASAGALLVLAVIVLADRRVGDGVTLLIIGLMVGYLCAAVIDVLKVASPAGALKGYVLWGLGSFGAVDPHHLWWFSLPVLVGIGIALVLVKPLDALLLGEEYAHSLGVNVPRLRRAGIWTTGLLAGSITAFCGPIAFLGLATPHVARALLRNGSHRALMPASVLLGAVLALGCDLLVRNTSASVALPLNAITSLLGAPVVLWVLLSGRQWARRT
ncbi:MAG TPA: iron ABC transporter permease [Flavobacteriales bacterium]|jgi:iron complex transport system permease protein|nr:iron ABC transporter permease [Flavobacteriales bacterium]